MVDTTSKTGTINCKIILLRNKKKITTTFLVEVKKHF